MSRFAPGLRNGRERFDDLRIRHPRVVGRKVGAGQDDGGGIVKRYSFEAFEIQG